LHLDRSMVIENKKFYQLKHNPNTIEEFKEELLGIESKKA
jgi:hypothetical protein